MLIWLRSTRLLPWNVVPYTMLLVSSST